MSKNDKDYDFRQTVIMDDLRYIAKDLRERREAEKLAGMTPQELEIERRSQKIADNMTKTIGFGCLFVVLFVFFLILFYAILD